MPTPNSELVEMHDGCLAPSLLHMSFELTVMGIILSALMFMTGNRMDAWEVTIVCLFLAAMFVFKMVFPSHLAAKYFVLKSASLLLCFLFSWWLIYEAETTRAGWYRWYIIESRVQSIVKNAPAYIITANSDGIITGASENIYELTGYTREDLIGRDMTILMRREQARRHRTAYKEAVRKLQGSKFPDAGWLMQGELAVAIRRKDYRLVPIHAYAGGIRWSGDIQFKDDIDMFSILVPIPDDVADEEGFDFRGNGNRLHQPPVQPPGIMLDKQKLSTP